MGFPASSAVQIKLMHHRCPGSGCTWFLLLLGFIWCDVGSASEQLSALLQRLQIDEVQHFQYREKKRLSLLSHPWIATGDLFLAPGEVLLSQLRPRETRTLITKTRLQHFDLEGGRHYSRVLSDTTRAQGLGALLPLLAADEQPAKITEQYDAELRHRDSRWLLILKPTPPSGEVQDIRLSGEPRRPADRIVLEFRGGDSIEWRLTPQAIGPLARQRMLLLKDSLAGQRAP